MGIGIFLLVIFLALAAARSTSGVRPAEADSKTREPIIAKDADSKTQQPIIAKDVKPSLPGVGAIAQVTRPAACGLTRPALDEMNKWLSLHDTREAARVAISTGSGFLWPGDTVKVLDLGGFMYATDRVRVIARKSGQANGGFTCWVSGSAFQ